MLSDQAKCLLRLRDSSICPDALAMLAKTIFLSNIFIIIKPR